MKNLAKFLDAPPVQLAIGAVIVIGAIYFILRKTVSDVAETVGVSTKGTAFEGTGLIGIAGNITNKISGGILATTGEKISGFFFPIADPSANLFYVATFPNGERHAIPSPEVDKNGFFFYKSVRYRLAWDTATPRRRIAIAA